jgi:hypothetical protein
MIKQIKLQTEFDKLKDRWFTVIYFSSDEESNLFRYINGTEHPKGIIDQDIITKEYYDRVDEIKSILYYDLQQYSFDLILCPPSSKNINNTFRDSLKYKLRIVNDISSSVVKTDNLKIGKETELSDVEFKKHLNFDPSLILPGNNLLIFDDIIFKGRTIAAILSLLMQYNLPIIDNAILASIYCFL